MIKLVNLTLKKQSLENYFFSLGEETIKSSMSQPFTIKGCLDVLFN